MSANIHILGYREVPILNRKEGNKLVSENGYYVQVKSKRDVIKYTGKQCEWLIQNMDLPLLIVVANKTDQCIDIYSTWRAWWAFTNIPIATKVHFHLGNSRVFKTRHSFTYENDILRIALGKPIVHLKYTDIESDLSRHYEILRKWIALDSFNIRVFRDLGSFILGYTKWNCNEEPDEGDQELFIGFPRVEDKIHLMITGYLSSLARMLNTIPDHPKIATMRNLVADFGTNYLDIFDRAIQHNVS